MPTQDRRIMSLPARAPRIVLLVSVLLLGPLVSPPASGQTVEQKAGARAAADAGAEAFDQGRYEEAIDLFSRAEAVVHAPPHLLYIARSQIKLDRLIRAQDTYLKIVRERLPADAPTPFKEAWAAADRELDDLEPRIPQVTLRVEGAANGDVDVTLDGRPVPKALLGIPQPVDPGPHELRADAGQGRMVARSVRLTPGARESVTLTLPPLPSAAPALVPSAAPSPTRSPRPETRRASAPEGLGLWDQPAVAYGALGVGVVGLGVGTGFLVAYLGTRSDADQGYDACPRPCPTETRTRVDELDSRAARQGTTATVGMVVGGLGVATGVTLLVLQRRGRPDTERGLAVHPYVAGNAVGLWGRY
jgi:hypothetical protein